MQLWGWVEMAQIALVEIWWLRPAGKEPLSIFMASGTLDIQSFLYAKVFGKPVKTKSQPAGAVLIEHVASHVTGKAFWIPCHLRSRSVSIWFKNVTIKHAEFSKVAFTSSPWGIQASFLAGCADQPMLPHNQPWICDPPCLPSRGWMAQLHLRLRPHGKRPSWFGWINYVMYV